MRRCRRSRRGCYAPAQPPEPGSIASAMASRPRADGPDGALALPGTMSLAARLSLPRVRVRLGPVAGGLALGSLVPAVVALVLVTPSGPSLMLARSLRVFPGWESG